MTRKHRDTEPDVSAAAPETGDYWRRTRRLALAALFLWVVAAVLLPMASEYMEAVAVLGIPVGYYTGSIGGLIVVALVLLIVAIRQRRIDHMSGQDD